MMLQLHGHDNAIGTTRDDELQETSLWQFRDVVPNNKAGRILFFAENFVPLQKHSQKGTSYGEIDFGGPH